MKANRHSEIDIAIKASSGQIAALHVEMTKEVTRLLEFPHDYLSKGVLGWLIKTRLEQLELSPTVLHSDGQFNSSTYLFDVIDGRGAAIAIRALMADMGDANDIDPQFSLLPVCEIAWLDDGIFRFVHPAEPEGAFERWLSADRVNGEHKKLIAYAKRMQNTTQRSGSSSMRAVKTAHAKRVAELFRKREGG
jgi:hypothetical protein